MNRVVVLAGFAVMLGLTSRPAAQSAAKSRFEVASVKSSDPNAVGPGGRPVLPKTRPPVGGRFIASDMTLRDLVKQAYDFWFDFRIEGGPEWLTSRRFDIQAKAEDPAADLNAMRPMIRALLVERFKLKVHTEMREMPIYALVIARDDGRLGANIKPSTADCSNPGQLSGADVTALLEAGRRVPCAIMPEPTRVAGSVRTVANGVSMAALADYLIGAAGAARMVYDRTGLNGLYDWELTFDRRATLSPDSTSDSPVLTTALREQLGLKLESARGPVEVLVIDSAALPGPD